MRIRTCDICCEPLQETGVGVQVEAPRAWTSVDLCEVCALPVLELLKQNDLLKKPHSMA